LDKDEAVDFYRGYFVTFFEESPTPNRLSMDKTQGITQLFASGMIQRQIARALVIDGKCVKLYLARQDKANQKQIVDDGFFVN
jgi:DNA-binding NarL/FixJ family response regulator